MAGFARPLPDWPRALGPAAARALWRVEPEDFQVTELPLVEPDGTGSHLWLEVRKRDANTRWVAARLAECAGAAVRDVGYAGMKDRRAVTTQWFSIGLQEAADADWAGWDIPGVAILSGARHGRKLQRGALKGNRFRIVLREVRGDFGALGERLETLSRNGLPNYFGPQRFGRDGANAERGARWLERGGRIKRGQRSIYLSAVRSFLFNQVLAERVRKRSWNRLVDGDVVQLAGSRSVFVYRIPETEPERRVLEQRCADLDIHPTGPLPGDGEVETATDARAIERSALEPYESTIAALSRARVRSGRRALRIAPSNLRWELEGNRLVLEFDLPPGAYATSLLRELVSTGAGTISVEE